MHGTGDAQAALTAFFGAYAAAFDDADADAIADFYVLPAVIWQFGTGHLFDDRDELAENAEKLIDAFDEAGIVTTETTVRTANVSGDTAFATVDWSQSDDAGEELHAFTCHYMLIRDAPGWRIVTVVNAPPVDGTSDEDDAT
ncbi:MAG: nuclear transport factor 2 family protein [Pseudomonadota bacterium]